MCKKFNLNILFIMYKELFKNKKSIGHSLTINNNNNVFKCGGCQMVWVMLGEILWGTVQPDGLSCVSSHVSILPSNG